MKKTKTCTRCLDRNSEVWYINQNVSYDYVISILNQVRYDYQSALSKKGYVTLIDILDYLDLPVSREALTLGWTWDNEEKFPDLTLFMTHNGDTQAPFDHKIEIKFVDLVDLSKILDPDTAII